MAESLGADRLLHYSKRVRGVEGGELGAARKGFDRLRRQLPAATFFPATHPGANPA